MLHMIFKMFTFQHLVLGIKLKPVEFFGHIDKKHVYQILRNVHYPFPHYFVHKYFDKQIFPFIEYPLLGASISSVKKKQIERHMQTTFLFQHDELHWSIVFCAHDRKHIIDF